MIRRCSIVPITLLTLLSIHVVGCASKPVPTPPPPPPSMEQAASLKAALLEVNPNAKVGMVTTVVADFSMAMIGDVDATGVRTGDLFSIVDSTSSVIANGIVEKTEDGKIAVRYTPVVRAPMVGDIAVKF